MKQTENIKIEYVGINLLKPYPGNPRDFDTKGKADLKRSIKKFGWTSPLLINMASGRKYLVLSGNMRLEVAQEMKMKEVPCVKVVIDDLEKEKEILLRMNVLNGSWDIELLKDFDIEIVLESGFKDFEMANIWDDALEVDNDDFDVEKAIEEIKVPKSRVGDLYQLGRHRIICGNSEDPEVIKRLVEKDKINLLSCDPVYNISYSYSGKGNKYGAEVKDTRTDQEYRAFLKKTMQNGLAVCHDDLHAFWFCDQRYIGVLQSLYEELGLDNKRVCLWVKNNSSPVPQVAFSKAYEACPYSTRGKPYLAPIHNLNEILNREIGTGNRTIDDIIDLFDIWLVKRLPTSEYEHATTKPPTLYEKLLRRCSKPNDTVLDLFTGSGSQLIACESLKRQFFGVELEPLFVDVTIRRWEELTGQKAVLIKEEVENEAK